MAWRAVLCASVLVLASDAWHQRAPSVPAHVGRRGVLRLRGGAKGARKIVYLEEDTKACMGGTVKTERDNDSEDLDGYDPFQRLIQMVNETTLSEQKTSARVGVLARTMTTANQTGISPRKDWWDAPETTREEVGTYLRAQDETFPDADNHPRLNADLVTAATYGRVHVIRELVALGAQVNAGGAGGSSMWVPLHHAARYGRPKAVKVLLELGARVNISTWGRWTPLHFAAAVAHRDITRVLLEAGANMYAVNADGSTPFDAIVPDDDGNTVEDIFEEFGFSELANGAAKSSVHFRAPQMPRNKEGELPYMDLMLGDADDWVIRETERDDAPPDRVTEIKDVGLVEDWNYDTSFEEGDDTLTPSLSDSSDDEESEDEGGQPVTEEGSGVWRGGGGKSKKKTGEDEETALEEDMRLRPEEWTRIEEEKMPYNVDFTPEPARPGEKSERVTVAIYPHADAADGEHANVVSVKATRV